MTKKQSTYSSVDIKDKLWEKAKIIPNKNKDLYRKDPNGDILYKNLLVNILIWDLKLIIFYLKVEVVVIILEIFSY